MVVQVKELGSDVDKVSDEIFELKMDEEELGQTDEIVELNKEEVSTEERGVDSETWDGVDEDEERLEIIKLEDDNSEEWIVEQERQIELDTSVVSEEVIFVCKDDEDDESFDELETGVEILSDEAGTEQPGNEQLVIVMTVVELIFGLVVLSESEVSELDGFELITLDEV